MRRLIAALAGAIMLLATLAAVPAAADVQPLFPVNQDVTLQGSPTYDRMKDRDGVVVGVKEDQPGLGAIDVVTGERSGFDVDIARWIAASLGFAEDQITYKAIASANREQAIKNGDIDYYVGTYSITGARKKQIDFAGPYLTTGQSLLVPRGSGIRSEKDLGPDTKVCSATGSAPIQNIKKAFPDVPTTEFDVYSACVEALRNGQVDAVTTDQPILLGYAALYPDEMEVVGEPFTEENYGVGLLKGDDALRSWINRLFTDHPGTWQKIYDSNLGSTGVTIPQPEVDNYRSTGESSVASDDAGPRAGVITDNLDLWGEALRNTLLLFFAGGALAVVLGFVVGAMRVSPVPIARAVGAVYVNLIRNTPLTVIFFFFAFGYPALGLPTPGFTVLAIGALGIYTATYIAEVIRAGINTVPAGQAEAARAIGLPFTKVMTLVVLPQAFRSVVPPMMSVLIALLKNTTVAAGFSVAELGVIRANLSERGEDALAVLLCVAAIFVVMVLVLSAIQRTIENRWKVAR